MDGGPLEVNGLSRAQEQSHGPPQTPAEAQEATPTPSAFGVPPASLLEDTPQNRRDSLFSNTSMLQSPELELLKVIQAIATCQPPKPVDTPQIERVWEEGVMEGTLLPSDWKPTRIIQDDLDQVFKETLEPTAQAKGSSEAQAEGSSEGNPAGTSLVSGYPAGYESELGSNLDVLELEAPSDQFTDFEEEVEDWFCRTRSTRPPSSYLSGKIAQDKSEQINKKEKEWNEPTAQSSTLFRHSVATIFTVLAKEVSPPPAATSASRAVGLFYDPTTEADEPIQLRCPLTSPNCLGNCQTLWQGWTPKGRSHQSEPSN